MAYYLIDNFASGLDLRRSAEVAPPGSLRRLENAFVNEGGEIEKRKAFVKHDVLTAMCQIRGNSEYVGPFPSPGSGDSVFFMSRNDGRVAGDPAANPVSAYATDWTQMALLSNPGAMYHVDGEFTFYSFDSPFPTTDPANVGYMTCGISYSEFSDFGYVVEHHIDGAGVPQFNHAYVEFADGAPVVPPSGPEVAVEVTANADRAFQKILKNKGYVVLGDVLFASAVGTPDTMTGTGSGSLNLSTQGASIGDAISLGEYYGQLAIFGKRGVQFYSVDPDFAQTQYLRRVTAFLLSPKSVVEYGDGDVIFLTRSGVRSLQARDSSNFAKVTDVGSPIDALLRDALQSSSETELMGQIARKPSDYFYLAAGAVLPDTGHLWMAVRDRIYVLSRYASAKVQAWSEYILPFPAATEAYLNTSKNFARWVADVCPIGETLMFRTFADEVFIYGGIDGDTYDDTKATIELPFIDAGRPGDNKYFTGLDLVCRGEWLIEACTVAKGGETPSPWVTVAQVTDTTRGNDGRIPMNMQGTQIAFRLTTTDVRSAKVAQLGVFYDMAAQK